MNTKTSIVRKMNTKGQVTLPSSWRTKIGTDTVVVEDLGSSLVIRPAEVITGEEVLFDAVRDNNGKGILAEDFIKALKKEVQ